MTCRGKCEIHRATGRPNAGRYNSGQKRCIRCDVFLQWLGLWCPCCGLRLRGKPRNGKSKKNGVARY